MDYVERLLEDTKADIRRMQAILRKMTPAQLAELAAKRDKAAER